ncbi:hypothetical protein [Enterococcus sp. BWR-S5]|uniref:ParM/StbA family protein n=1 Tax=Enterococcus sp. BWR-S5 TaxID=2787714 RepID=UPI001923B02F|nr:hypothetical protein [Enterococcus sp. BWR-S5]MBL1227230.1 hypothetical protein [Enterococcus sp. BWR-S5]
MIVYDLTLDLGNVQIRMGSNINSFQLKIPTKLLNRNLASTAEVNSFKSHSGIYECQLVGELDTYFLGNDIYTLEKNAQITDTIELSVQHYSDPYFLKLSSFSLGLLAKECPPDENGEVNAKVTIGISPDTYTDSLENKLKKALLKQHFMVIDGKRIVVNVLDIAIKPEPFGIHLLATT